MPGYDYVFVDKVLERYVCAICLEVMKDAVETACGHCYCHQCLKDTTRCGLEPRGENVCPVCRCAIAWDTVHPLVRLRREISNLSVFCPHKDIGCDHVTSVQHIEDHIAHCQAEMRYRRDTIPPYMCVPLLHDRENLSTGSPTSGYKEPSAPPISLLEEEPAPAPAAETTAEAATPSTSAAALELQRDTCSVWMSRLNLVCGLFVVFFLVAFFLLRNLL